MNKSILAANIVRMLMTSLSLIASSTIVHSIRHSYKGLKSPYSARIIFGLSIGDIIQSSAIIINPFMIPKNAVESVMAIGNTFSCDIQFRLSCNILAFGPVVEKQSLLLFAETGMLRR